jgi:hypothetical protein
MLELRYRPMGTTTLLNFYSYINTVYPYIISMINDNCKSFDTSKTFVTTQLFENHLYINIAIATEYLYSTLILSRNVFCHFG